MNFRDGELQKQGTGELTMAEVVCLAAVIRHVSHGIILGDELRVVVDEA